MPRRSHRLGFLAAVLALVVATLVAYAPALHGPFELDDVDAIVNNPTITRLSPLSVPLSPPAATPVAGRPFVNLTFAANYAINAALGIDQSGGMRGAGVTTSYHVVNLALHVACGLLLLALMLRTLRNTTTSARARDAGDWLAFAVVAIWTLHPLQTEAVDYLTQRTELVVSLCYVATLYFAARAWDAAAIRTGMAWCAAAVAACLLGMASKEVMITAPIAVVLYDLAFHRDAMWTDALARRRRLALYAVLCATSIPLLVAVSSGARADSVGFRPRCDVVPVSLLAGVGRRALSAARRVAVAADLRLRPASDLGVVRRTRRGAAQRPIDVEHLLMAPPAAACVPRLRVLFTARAVVEHRSDPHRDRG